MGYNRRGRTMLLMTAATATTMLRFDGGSETSDLERDLESVSGSGKEASIADKQ